MFRHGCCDKTILAKVGDVDIGPAIVVIIAHGNAEAPAVIRDPGLHAHIRERSVTVVVEESRVRRGPLSAQSIFR